MKVTGIQQNIYFSGVRNAEDLKKLYRYEVPCVYTGLTMIDSQDVVSINKSLLNGPLPLVVKTLTPYENSMQIAEKKVFEIIKSGAEVNPNMCLSDFMQNNLRPFYEERLKCQQYRIMDSLTNLSDKLAPKAKVQFEQLMQVHADRIEGRAVFIPFSREGFKMELERTLETMTTDEGLIKHITNLGKDMPHYSVPGAAVIQTKAVKSMNNEVNKFIAAGKLFKSPDLQEVFSTAYEQINNKSIVKPFSNKSFVHDLKLVLSGMNNNSVQQQFEYLARLLPNSLNDFGAFVVKLANKSSPQIATALLDSSVGSIEHIRPKSLGGSDSPKNYLLACRGVNSMRSNETLFRWLTVNPGMMQNIQKSFDRLVELQNEGLFEKLKIPQRWLEEVAAAVEYESGGVFTPDLSKLKKGLMYITSHPMSLRNLLRGDMKIG